MVEGRGRSPGRLDLLGGVADYSGALVLEAPTQCATTVDVAPAGSFVVRSGHEVADVPPRVMSACVAATYAEVRASLDDASVPGWARYVLGAALVARRRGLLPLEPSRFTVASDVPRSMGVSSSAALEVATLRALCARHGVAVDPVELALAAQEAENRVVGAPCGAMDQLAVSCGRAGDVVPILCRPADVRPVLPLPPGALVVGWPSGVRHRVAGDEYGTARTAAAMARRIVEVDRGIRVGHTSALPESALGPLPEAIEGRRFTERYGPVADDLAVVRDGVEYPVAAAGRFAVEEHRRSGQALQHLRSGDPAAVGPLMRASHIGYTSLGLGHPATDGIVEQALAAGAWGARASGGGCGGTVVVLGDATAVERITAMPPDVDLIR